jgi:stage III sporulation protein AD
MGMEILDILKIFEIALFVVILSFIFKELKKEYSVMLMIAGGIIITLWGLARIYPVVDYIRELTDSSNISEYFSVILKVLGISFIVQTGADICRDFGEASIASKVEFAGKAAILAVVLPVLRSVINMGLDLLR